MGYTKSSPSQSISHKLSRGITKLQPTVIKLLKLFTKRQIFGLDQIQSICRRQNVGKIMISLLDKVENIVGKGENAGHFIVL